jgi:hypothetical protein
MEFVKLTEDNTTEFEEYVPVDILENIGRTYYRGLVATEYDEPVAGMIWLNKNMREGGPGESNIVWLDLKDETVGDELFREYDRMLDSENITRASFSLPAKSTKPLKGFLKSKGFSVKLMEGDTIVARLSEVGEIPFIKKIKPSDDIMPLRSVTQRGFNIAVRRMVARGYYGLCEDIENLPRMYFENDVSCYCEQEGIINGLFLCHRTASGMLLVEMMAAIGQDYVKQLPMLIAGAYQNAIGIYPPETEIIIDRHNYASLALGEKLFPRTFGIPMYIGSREN